MPEYKLSYQDPEDGCLYCIEETTGEALKICVVPAEKIPESIRARIKADRERLAALEKVVL
jgi:hypothetical protein